MDPISPIGTSLDQKEETVRITGSSLASTGGRAIAGQAAEEFIGQVIFEHYQIESIIGSGGMSVVYKARHLLLNQTVAIKMLHTHLARDEHALMRFKQEAQSASRLDHAMIVGVRDFGILPSGQAVLIIDYAPGLSLNEVIARGPMDPKRALKICQGVCEALTHAHSQGIIHRDIKPSNVIVINEGTEQETIKIVDFGIAKVLWDDQPEGNRQQLTHTGESLGSPPYMSPEQCQGGALDARSDVYSAGCMLFELLTGRPPFCGGSVFETIHMQITALPPSVAKLRPGLVNSESLDALVLTAIAKDAGQRFQSSAEFQDAVGKTLEKFDKPNILSRAAARLQVAASRVQAKRRALLSLAFVVGLLIATGFLATKFQSISIQSQESSEPQKMVLSGLDAFESAFHEGNTLLSMDAFADAKAKFSEALLHGDAVGEESQEYQDCLQRLVTCLRHSGTSADSARADNLAERLSKIQKFGASLGTVETNSDEISKLALITPQTREIKIKLAQTLRNQASLYLLQHKVSMAADTASNAYKLSGENLPADDPTTVRSLSVLVGALGEQSQFSQAEPLAKKLLSTAEANRDKHPELLAEALSRLARLHYNWALWVQDKDVVSIDAAVQLAALPSNPQSVRFLHMAQSEAQQAVELYRQIYQGASPRLADALTQLGGAQLMLGQTAEAEKAINEALVNNLQIRGETHMATAKSLAYLARIEALQAELLAGPLQHSLLNRADENLRKAQVIFESGSSDSLNSALLGETLNMRALVNARQGNFNEAEKLYKASVKIARAWEKDAWTARTAYLRLVDLYRNSSLPEDQKTAKMAALMQSVQDVHSIPNLPKAKPVNDLDKPIQDGDR